MIALWAVPLFDPGKIAWKHKCRNVSVTNNCFRVISHAMFFVTVCFRKMNKNELIREAYRNITATSRTAGYRDLPTMRLTQLLHNRQTQTTATGLLTP